MGRKYQSIHRRQLFHWLGRHIDYANAGDDNSRVSKLTEPMRENYLDALAGALDPDRGLWLKVPRAPDRIGDGDLVSVTQPILCFTEWSLGESLPHAYKYGRLGLGFSKHWVLNLGGQPVSYIRARADRDPFTQSLLALGRYFRQRKGPRWQSLKSSFEYLTQFIKKVQMDKLDKAARAEQRKSRGAAGKKRLRKQPDEVALAERRLPKFHRNYGEYLEYLEEREWRLVYHAGLEGRVKKNTTPPPEYYLPIAAGRELFTVVLPDNRTVHKLLTEDKRQTLAKALLQPTQDPHVTLLSLEDIGTF